MSKRPRRKGGELCYENENGSFGDDWIHAEILSDDGVLKENRGKKKPKEKDNG